MFCSWMITRKAKCVRIYVVWWEMRHKWLPSHNAGQCFGADIGNFFLECISHCKAVRQANVNNIWTSSCDGNLFRELQNRKPHSQLCLTGNAASSIDFEVAGISIQRQFMAKTRSCNTKTRIKAMLIVHFVKFIPAQLVTKRGLKRNVPPILLGFDEK